MESKINEILNEMAEYLSAEQQKRLQQVLVAKLSENRKNDAPATNEDYKTLFLNAKKIEGCSERTIIYYGTTLDHFFGEAYTVSISPEAQAMYDELIKLGIEAYNKKLGK